MSTNLPDMPPELSDIDLPDWAQFLAQDEDGAWWAYEAHPNQQHNGWYENEVGRIKALVKGAPNDNWEDSLIRL